MSNSIQTAVGIGASFAMVRFLPATLICESLADPLLMAELPMDDLSHAINNNIKRYQNLLETSVEEAERQTIQRLLSEEKAKAALPVSESKMK